jgi:putative membrane protein
MSSPIPPNLQAELARERNRQAADRSLLSFVRNSLTLITFGVGIQQSVRALVPEAAAVGRWVYGLSLLFTGLGVVSLLLAIADFQGEARRLEALDYQFTPWLGLSFFAGPGSELSLPCDTATKELL